MKNGHSLTVLLITIEHSGLWLRRWDQANVRMRPELMPVSRARPSGSAPRCSALGSNCSSYDERAMDLTTVSPKFQVVIPRRVREQFGLRPGQRLQVIALPGRIELVPTQSPAELRGFLQGRNTFQREDDRL